MRKKKQTTIDKRILKAECLRITPDFHALSFQEEIHKNLESRVGFIHHGVVVHVEEIGIPEELGAHDAEKDIAIPRLSCFIVLVTQVALHNINRLPTVFKEAVWETIDDIMYCHRFFRPPPKGRLCYNTISLERSYPMAKRRKFTPEFKAEVVLEVLSGATSQAEVCRRHNLNENQLSQWKRQLLENASTLFDSTDKQSSDAEKRIAHLEQLVGRLTVALDIEKKALDWLK